MRKSIGLAVVLGAITAYGAVKPERGVYLATHFGNWYEMASDAEAADYVKELATWGCTTIGVWFDMHNYTGVDDPAAQAALARLKLIFRTAKDCGVGRDLLFIANEGFAGSPENLRADWRAGQNGYVKELYHFHVELCPSRPGATEQLLKWRRQVFDAFADSPPTSVTIFPYDQGGCSCANCAPWGVNGFMRLLKPLSEMTRERFPGALINVSTWCFDFFGPNLGEWDGFLARREELKKLVDRIFPENPGLKYMDANPFLPYFNMTEISMRGMFPWGGYGANPQPRRIQNEIDSHPGMCGARPYSEGIYEDMNKVMVLALLSGRAKDTTEAAKQYAARYFGASTSNRVAEAALLMEEALPLPPKDGKRPDAAKAERELALLEAAEKDMGVEARTSWRWRLLKIRAQIDVAVAHGEKASAVEPLIDELCRIYHVGPKTMGCVKPRVKVLEHALKVENRDAAAAEKI